MRSRYDGKQCTQAAKPTIPQRPWQSGHPGLKASPSHIYGTRCHQFSGGDLDRQNPFESVNFKSDSDETAGEVPRRPPRAVKAAARRVRGGLRPAGQRSAARQTPHIPFFFQKNGDFSV
jgi:hypothetical protein